MQRVSKFVANPKSRLYFNVLISKKKSRHNIWLENVYLGEKKKTNSYIYYLEINLDFKSLLKVLTYIHS